VSETKHSPEPWVVIGDEEESWGIREATGGVIQWDFTEEDARRIVAAVNACKDLSTAALEAGVLGDALLALAVLVDPGEPAATRSLAHGQAQRSLRALGRIP